MLLITLLYFFILSVADDGTSRPARPIVVDAETMARVSDATVVIDDGKTQRTIYDGSFAVPDSFSVITITKRGYLQRIINRNELTDTIKLLNNGKCLDEVVVIGHYPKAQFSFGRAGSSTATGSKSNSFGTFDMNQLLDNIFNYKRHKRLKKVRKVLKDY